jgi:hypothetical protein
LPQVERDPEAVVDLVTASHEQRRATGRGLRSGDRHHRSDGGERNVLRAGGGRFRAPSGLARAPSARLGCGVIADSAEFSAALTEVTDGRYIGTALTAQTAIGFLLT